MAIEPGMYTMRSIQYCMKNKGYLAIIKLSEHIHSSTPIPPLGFASKPHEFAEY